MELNRLALEHSNYYMQNAKVEAVLLGGSVSRNWQDKFSDIELFIFWRENPTEEDRKRPITLANGSIIDFHPYEEEEWSETYVAQCVKFEISNFLTSTIQKISNEVILEFDTDLNKQCLVASVHEGIRLGGEQVIYQLKEQIKGYPAELSKAMISQNMNLGNRWHNREALLAREDWLMLYKVIVSVQEKIMGILFGLNRVYVHHPAYKWQKKSLENMTVVPENVVSRLTSILLEHPEKGIRELEVMIGEIFDLIQKEYPDMDVTEVREKTLFLRPENIMDVK
ncbi:hypothetical protein NCCP2222_31990 [Sporosarcina sp. NCCP-2222]|uniref:DUF4037 domain-containing protein n=1 Tax=Sporosarcina sp. NCCP-2222 TaxID=2935073 RepID=UPI00207DD224|nr:DUF4037 domain-containing protein [Sporosarcina sp. NCCP-2222]GKV57252.1 hypothetical protein NCCP2222_31990 [Sporosarcina sp. NCCP-2222]